MWQGQQHIYYPDFILKFEGNRHLILEVKGRKKDQDDAKWAAAKEWVNAVNADGNFGHWAFAVLDDPADLFKVINTNISAGDVEKSDLFFSDVVPDGSYAKGLLPVYDLHAYATSFKGQKTPECLGWKPYNGKKKLQDGMFIAQVAGKSMESTLPDRSWCVFRPDQGGTRNNKIVLVESRHIRDPETSKSYTIKRYFSEKAAGEDENSFRHIKIVLKPDNKDFADIVLPEGTMDGEFHVVAEWVETLNSQ